MQNNIQLTIKAKLVNILAALAYVLFYDFIYKSFIVSRFDTLYSTYGYIQNVNQVFYYILGVVPILFFTGVKSVSSALSIFMYIFVYIPFMETLAVCGYGESFNLYRVVFFISMIFFFLTDGKTINLSIQHTGKMAFAKFEKVITIVFLIVIAINVPNMRLTNFLTSRAELYENRANLHLNGGAIVNYILFWCNYAIFPLLVVFYLKTKRIMKWAFAMLGTVCIYMLDQQKMTFVMPFVVTGMFFIYHRGKYLLSKYYFVILATGTIIMSLFLFAVFNKSELFYELACILIMRTVCIEGMELCTYFNFFEVSNHPYTYYTHIGIINAITDAYPYGSLSLGNVVTYGGANANGNFWLMDGIAGAGVFGCILTSFLFILVKAWLSSIDKDCDPRLLSVIFIPSLCAMVNVSLFTTLFSCGFILFYIIFKCVDFGDVFKSTN